MSDAPSEGLIRRLAMHIHNERHGPGSWDMVRERERAKAINEARGILASKTVPAAAIEAAVKHGEAMAAEQVTALQKQLKDTRHLLAAARRAIGFFIADERFQVTVGGNPLVVEDMLRQVAAIYEETSE